MSRKLDVNISDDKSKIEIYDPVTGVGQVITGRVDTQTMGNIIADYLNFIGIDRDISQENIEKEGEK